MALTRSFWAIWIMLACLVVSAATIAAAEPSLEKGNEAKVPGKLIAPSSEQEIALREALRRPTKLDFAGPLSDALQMIAQTYKVEIWIDELALAEAGVSTHEPVDVDLQGVALSDGLREVLGRHKLDYMVQDGVLKITSAEVAARTLTIVIHDLTSLSEVGIQPDNAVPIVQQIVEPDSWNIQGGAAAVLPLPAALLVKQTQRGHEEIDLLLAKVAQHMARTRRMSAK